MDTRNTRLCVHNYHNYKQIRFPVDVLLYRLCRTDSPEFRCVEVNYSKARVGILRKRAVCENGTKGASTNVLQLFLGRFSNDSWNYRSVTSQQKILLAFPDA